MTMPKWHETMRPILAALAKSPQLNAAELRDAVAGAWGVTEEEKREALKGGGNRFSTNVNWGAVSLVKAGMAERVKRGVYAITPNGRALLTECPVAVTNNDLATRSAPYREWQEKSHAKKPAKGNDMRTPSIPEAEATPEDLMEEAAAKLKQALADQLLQAVMDKDPYFFEHLVGKLLIAMGYGASNPDAGGATQKSGDEGIDGVVREDRLGFDSIFYQAKRWDPSHQVGRPEIQAFVGALSGKGATKGLFITTSTFSRQAKEYAKGLHAQKIVLIDGEALANLMIDYGVGVTVRTTYEIKAIDGDFFSEE